MQPEPIYETLFVRQLFNEMSATYGLVNVISSFGFCRRWRRQCIAQLDFPVAGTVVDLMTGMGELCPSIARRVGRDGRIQAVDISPAMCKRAQANYEGKLTCPVEILEADALCSDVPSESADVVVCSFGLKTFSDQQILILAKEVQRILKPGGTFAFVEISVPASRWLQIPYMFYLQKLIPVIGRLLMGNPDNYRMLGVYTMAFDNCESAMQSFRKAGLDTDQRSYFFGCATGLVGTKPNF